MPTASAFVASRFSAASLAKTTLLCLVFCGADAITADADVVLQPVGLQMIRDTAVHRELDLDADQKTQLFETLTQIDPPWFRARNLPPAEQQTEVESLGRQLDEAMGSILKPDQRERFAELQRQALGTRMFLRSDVVDRLSITPDQTERLIDLYEKTDRGNADLQQRITDGGIPLPKANKEQAKLQTAERTGVMSILNDQQKSQIGSLTGETFALSKIVRMYPLAPPIATEGAEWIQGGPVELGDLRGKVVAVHFYAFQCINCIRNLPHYSAWHKDYADDGLVVIGIQTPETPAERDYSRVAAAVANEGIAYPVVLDGQSKSWQAYSNTMWPTVYLIDKQGFLRRWWQGELNWKGGNGEQQLRETIEQLLAE